MDTSGWGSLVDSKQQYHPDAKIIYAASKSSQTRLITTNYIIAELSALLYSPLRIVRSRSIQFLESIRKSAMVDLVHVNEALDSKAWELFAGRHDKNWSLVDCSSFVVMAENNIQDALTTDRHFEQAGFVRLLS